MTMKALNLHKHCIRNRTMIVQDMYIRNWGTCKYMTYNNKQKTEQSKTAVIIVRYYNMDTHELFQDNYHGLNKRQKKQTERTFKNLQSTDTDLATLGTQDKNRYWPGNIGYTRLKQTRA